MTQRIHGVNDTTYSETLSIAGPDLGTNDLIPSPSRAHEGAWPQMADLGAFVLAALGVPENVPARS